MTQPMSFKEEKESIQFSQFEFDFEFMRHPCDLRKKRKV